MGFGLGFGPGTCACGCGCCKCDDNSTVKCSDGSDAVCVNSAWNCADNSTAHCAGDMSNPTCSGCPCCNSPCFNIAATPYQWMITGFGTIFLNGDCSDCNQIRDPIIVTRLPVGVGGVTDGCTWQYQLSGNCAGTNPTYGQIGLHIDPSNCVPVVTASLFDSVAMTFCPSLFGDSFTWSRNDSVSTCCEFTVSPTNLFPSHANSGACCDVDLNRAGDGGSGVLTVTPIPSCNCDGCCQTPGGAPTSIDWMWDWTSLANDAVPPCDTECETAGGQPKMHTLTGGGSSGACSWTYSGGGLTLTITYGRDPTTHRCTWTATAVSACYSLTYKLDETIPECGLGIPRLGLQPGGTQSCDPDAASITDAVPGFIDIQFPCP